MIKQAEILDKAGFGGSGYDQQTEGMQQNIDYSLVKKNLK